MCHGSFYTCPGRNPPENPAIVLELVAVVLFGFLFVVLVLVVLVFISAFLEEFRPAGTL